MPAKRDDANDETTEGPSRNVRSLTEALFPSLTDAEREAAADRFNKAGE